MHYFNFQRGPENTTLCQSGIILKCTQHSFFMPWITFRRTKIENLHSIGLCIDSQQTFEKHLGRETLFWVERERLLGISLERSTLKTALFSFFRRRIQQFQHSLQTELCATSKRSSGNQLVRTARELWRQTVIQSKDTSSMVRHCLSLTYMTKPQPVL